MHSVRMGLQLTPNIVEHLDINSPEPAVMTHGGRNIPPCHEDQLCDSTKTHTSLLIFQKAVAMDADSLAETTEQPVHRRHTLTENT